MSNSSQIRWGGLAAVFAGILYFLAALVHPAGEDVASVLSSTWVVAHLLGGFSAVFMLLGLVGLHALQTERTGKIGLIGFILAFVGTTFLAAEELTASSLLPLIAVQAPAVIQAQSSPTGAALVFALILLVGFLIGYILFGIATMRAGVLPRWAGALLVFGLLLSFGGPASHIISIIAAAVFGVGWVWLGYGVWSGTGERAQQPEPARVGL